MSLVAVRPPLDYLWRLGDSWSRALEAVDVHFLLTELYSACSISVLRSAPLSVCYRRWESAKQYGYA